MKLTIFVPVYNGEEFIWKALESIPKRKDIEILIINDCSTDQTEEIINEWKDQNKDLNIRIIKNETNLGLGAVKNIAFENAQGEYINELDCDDYLITEEYNKVIDLLDGTDIIYINLQINDGTIFRLCEESKMGFCSGCARFIRREFLAGTQCREIRATEDYFLNQDLQAKEHTDLFTDITAYHYNFPREGSLYDQFIKGQIKI